MLKIPLFLSNSCHLSVHKSEISKFLVRIHMKYFYRPVETGMRLSLTLPSLTPAQLYKSVQMQHTHSKLRGRERKREGEEANSYFHRSIRLNTLDIFIGLSRNPMTHYTKNALRFNRRREMLKRRICILKYFYWLLQSFVTLHIEKTLHFVKAQRGEKDF